jgi:hypothetical protein
MDPHTPVRPPAPRHFRTPPVHLPPPLELPPPLLHITDGGEHWFQPENGRLFTPDRRIAPITTPPPLRRGANCVEQRLEPDVHQAGAGSGDDRNDHLCSDLLMLPDLIDVALDMAPFPITVTQDAADDYPQRLLRQQQQQHRQHQLAQLAQLDELDDAFHTPARPPPRPLVCPPAPSKPARRVFSPLFCSQMRRNDEAQRAPAIKGRSEEGDGEEGEEGAPARPSHNYVLQLVADPFSDHVHNFGVNILWYVVGRVAEAPNAASSSVAIPHIYGVFHAIFRDTVACARNILANRALVNIDHVLLNVTTDQRKAAHIVKAVMVATIASWTGSAAAVESSPAKRRRQSPLR